MTMQSADWTAAEGISTPLRVTVTGANGFVGSHVISHFEGRRGFEVVSPSMRDFLPVDVIVSLAATADPRVAIKDPVGSYENNVRIMVQTLEYARKTGARVLHVSTNEVYGSGSMIGPVFGPVGPYGGGKACQEIICKSYEDVDTTIVVTQSLFGERQQTFKLIPQAIRSLLDGKPVSLQRNGHVWAQRPFLHVRNFAEALEHIVTTDQPERVHVGATELFAVKDVVEILSQELGVPGTVESVEAGDRPGHELDTFLIGCDVQGWRPTYETEPALRDVARWYLANQDWLP
jgi:dTDP-glucose 4,6-dehydratase